MLEDKEGLSVLYIFPFSTCHFWVEKMDKSNFPILFHYRRSFPHWFCPLPVPNHLHHSVIQETIQRPFIDLFLLFWDTNHSKFTTVSPIDALNLFLFQELHPRPSLKFGANQKSKFISLITPHSCWDTAFNTKLPGTTRTQLHQMLQFEVTPKNLACTSNSNLEFSGQSTQNSTSTCITLKHLPFSSQTHTSSFPRFYPERPIQALHSIFQKISKSG